MKLRKIITMSLAAVMAVSAMSISAFAKTDIELEDGVIMTIYEKGEVPDSIPVPYDVDQEAFSQIIGKFPSWSPLTLSRTGKTSLPLDSSQNVIQVDFDDNNQYSRGYQGLYDITAGKYLIDPNGDHLDGPFLIGSTLTFSNLTGGHSYRIMFSSTSAKTLASGKVWTY